MNVKVQLAVSILMLAGAIWAITFLLPKARREHDAFGIVCSLLAALAGLLGWLFIGVGTLSR